MSFLKKVLIGFAAVFGLFLGVTAHPVDQETAKAIAVKFMGTNDLELSTTYFTANGVATLYLFNARDGFVIVSADDCETPIIGYSHEGRLNLNDIPVQMEGYLQNFTTRIQYGIENNVVADEITERQWDLVKTKGRLNNDKTAKSVAPLITAQWHQGCLYNSLCPAMQNSPCDHARVGCVAVAMGMIMQYWKYPNHGWGSHSYYYGGTEISADFGNTYYDWEHISDSLADFPYLHCSNMPEAVHLGDLLRIWVRPGARFTPSPPDFQGPARAHRTPPEPRRFPRHGPLSRGEPIPGRPALHKEKRTLPGAPAGFSGIGCVTALDASRRPSPPLRIRGSEPDSLSIG